MDHRKLYGAFFFYSDRLTPGGENVFYSDLFFLRTEHLLPD